MKKLQLLGMVVGMVLAATAQAKTAEQAVDGNISARTEKFITNATIANKFEIDTSKLALDRSEDAEVRAFAQRMIEDHTKAGESMKAVLPTDANPTLGSMYDAKHEAKLDQLRNIREDQFDAAYVKVQTQAHDEAVTLFGDYAKNGDEKDLKDFAAATLPTLKAHQAHVKSFKKTAHGFENSYHNASTPIMHDMPGETPHAVPRSH